ncbi:hypothetical protein KC686_03985, partial [Candidatus Woesebacteria bacterium]|nr:hypothetical protein [Candidatus Woesebacteria bacterium]
WRSPPQPLRQRLTRVGEKINSGFARLNLFSSPPRDKKDHLNRVRMEKGVFFTSGFLAGAVLHLLLKDQMWVDYFVLFYLHL